jgi:hypothetical protein
MDLKIGILIIGSLWWDKIHGRPDWREKYLCPAEAINVPAPIRYGRFSAKRDSYTMLFSSSAGPGQAKVVPCANSIREPKDLVEESERLWSAEAEVNGQISSIWQSGRDGGGVVLCINEERSSNNHDLVIDAWKQRVLKEPTVYSNFPKSPDDKSSLVSKEGILSFWPNSVKLDFLLATANYPFKLDKPAPFPDPGAIANAWLKNLDKLEYFNGNCGNDIRTFQDEQIALVLSSKLDPLS